MCSPVCSCWRSSRPSGISEMKSTTSPTRGIHCGSTWRDFRRLGSIDCSARQSILIGSIIVSSRDPYRLSLSMRLRYTLGVPSSSTRFAPVPAVIFFGRPGCCTGMDGPASDTLILRLSGVELPLELPLDLHFELLLREPSDRGSTPPLGLHTVHGHPMLFPSFSMRYWKCGKNRFGESNALRLGCPYSHLSMCEGCPVRGFWYRAYPAGRASSEYLTPSLASPRACIHCWPIFSRYRVGGSTRVYAGPDGR
jgi:hypothetical protein